ncbi:hypothetical protein BH20VER2_BH20VER2_01630 [soil metagenome]
MPPPSSTPGTAGNILLVEEYGALAAAIGSALKKFAPGHRIRVAASLPEAETLLRQSGPVLLVVDVDPPQPGGLAFFQRAADVIPDARVLLLAATAPQELIQNLPRTAAFQLQEKPFELLQFGATVQGLLASGGQTRFGTLRNLGVTDVLSLQCLNGTTAILRVEKSKKRTGEIHLIGGQMTHAAAANWVGLEALREMLRWRSPRVTVSEERSTSARSLRGAWFKILAEALASIQEEDAVEPGESAPLPSAPAPAPVVRDGKKIVVIDDTEMLLIFVEEVLSTADPRLRITTASSGEEGVRTVTEVLPDLVLLDFSLPDLNGDEVCRRLLANEKTAKIPVVMMSGHVSEMTAAAARLDNIVATLAKPFLSLALVEMVKQTLTKLPTTSPKPAPKQLPPADSPKHKGHGNGKKPSAAPPSPPVAPPAPPAPAPVPPPPPLALVVSAPPTPPPVAPPPPAATIPLEVAAAKPALTLPAIFTGLAPVRIPVARNNNVVVGLLLEVISIQFSPALQMAAIRARLTSPTVSLHVDPQALPGVHLPEAGFRLARVDLDSRGQFHTLHLAPTVQQIATMPQPATALNVGSVSVLVANGGRAMEITPAPVAPMRLQLLASFELAGVELSASFGISSLVLKSRGGRMRVSLHPEAANTGAMFETAQVLLDRSARIAEILLDAVA